MTDTHPMPEKQNTSNRVGLDKSNPLSRGSQTTLSKALRHFNALPDGSETMQDTENGE